MILKLLTTLILVCLLLTTQMVWSADVDGMDCSWSGEATQTEKLKGRALTQGELFRQSYEEAECLRRVLATKGAEWLETESLLLQSREEADEGRLENALALAEKARLQVEQALHQAEHEEEAWKRRVVGSKPD